MSITPEGHLHQHEQERPLNQAPVMVENRSSKIRSNGLTLLGILFALAIAQAGYTWYLTKGCRNPSRLWWRSSIGSRTYWTN